MSNTIYDKLEKNVCKVISDNGQGTGFLISDKFILTAFHTYYTNKGRVKR